MTAKAIADRTLVDLAAFQDRLHDALQAFLNGDFVVPGSRPVELARPLSLGRCRIPWDLLQPALEAAERVRRRGDDADAREAGQPPRWVSLADAASLLSGMYRQLDALLDSEHGPAQQIAIARHYEPDRYERHRLRAVVDLARYARRHLAPYLTLFLVHGSLSTWDYTPYSDLDDLLVVSRATLDDPLRLQECAGHCVAAARYLYGHDPLHHHRHYVVTDVDLRAYPEAYLPLEAIELGTVLAGSDRLSVRTRDGTPLARTPLRRLANGIIGWSERRPMNVWELKTLVSSVLLLPALYLEATNGIYRYKRSTFEPAKAQLARVWTAVEIAGRIRREWHYRAGVRERLLRTLILRWLRNPPLYQHLIARRAPTVPPFLSRVVEETDFLSRAAELAREALRATPELKRESDADST